MDFDGCADFAGIDHVAIPKTPTLDLLFPLLGLLLCLFALGQMGLWAAQSISISSQTHEQFELAKQLIRDQIRTNKNERSAGSSLNELSTTEDLKATPPVAGQFRKLQVVRIVKETAGCCSVYFRPVDGRPIQEFVAGQHLPIRFAIPGKAKPVLRCYSLSNAFGDGHYRISVKSVSAPQGQSAVPPGLVSNFVNHDLKVGDIVEAKSPAGKFYLDKDSTDPIVMLAGGIGITPMVSMIEEAIGQSNERLMILVYGVRNRDEQAFRSWLDEKAAERENLVVVNCFSAPAPEDRLGPDYQVPGRVNIELLKQILPSPDCQFYLCGPPPFMDSLIEGLASWGVASDRVFSESFGPAAGDKSKRAEPLGVESAAAKQIKFAKAGSTATFLPGQTLLESIENAGVEIDSGCRAGSCESCLTRILKGQVMYPGGETPVVGANECLPCIAEPASDLELDL